MQLYHDWLHFFPTTLCPKGKNQCDGVGINIGEQAPLADDLFFTSWPLGHIQFKRIHLQLCDFSKLGRFNLKNVKPVA